MPRSRDLHNVLPELMTCCDASNDMQCSDDEKTTIHRALELTPAPKKSALRYAGSRSIKMRPNRKLRFTPFDEGERSSDYGGALPLRQQDLKPNPSLTRCSLHSFSSQIVQEIPHINDLSQEEVDSVWMNDDDFFVIRQECLGTVGEIGPDKVTDGFLLRGLDQHTHRYKETKGFIGRQVYDAVFSVQEFQRANGGIDCSELMSQLVQKYSEPSLIAAQSAALSDLFSSFKGTWTHRSIPTIPHGPLQSGTWAAQC